MPYMGEQPHGASSLLNHLAALLVLGHLSVISSRPFMFDWLSWGTKPQPRQHCASLSPLSLRVGYSSWLYLLPWGTCKVQRAHKVLSLGCACTGKGLVLAAGRVSVQPLQCHPLAGAPCLSSLAGAGTGHSWWAERPFPELLSPLLEQSSQYVTLMLCCFYLLRLHICSSSHSPPSQQNLSVAEMQKLYWVREKQWSVLVSGVRFHGWASPAACSPESFLASFVPPVPDAA